MPVQKSQFNGFNPDIYKFFKNLEKNNNKEWFDNNRDFYINEIREPLKLFSSAMSEYFEAKKLDFGCDPKKSVFRINRDIRFSANKDPYKTNMGIIFQYTASQKAQKQESVGIYIHYERDKSFIAGGLHIPQPIPLKAVRDRLLTDYKEFEKIITNKTFVKEFDRILEGESLSRPPKGFPSAHPAEKYLKMKDFIVSSTIDHKDFYSTKLMDIIIAKAQAIEPFDRFLLEAVG